MKEAYLELDFTNKLYFLENISAFAQLNTRKQAKMRVVSVY